MPIVTASDTTLGGVPSQRHAVVSPGELVALLARWAHGICRQSSLVTADELAQEAYLRLLQRYGAQWLMERPPGSLRGLAQRVLKNLFIDEIRRHRALGDEVAVRQARSQVIDPEAQLVASDEQRRLSVALASMAQHEREFLLEVMRCDSVPAAQARVGWPRASPYYHLSRLLAALRAELSR